MSIKITSFFGRYHFLSNFYERSLIIDGIPYPTSEHAFQALKTLNWDERLRISIIDSPFQAKRAGKKVTLRKNWDKIKIDVMYFVLLEKFNQNLELKESLLETGNMELIEGNSYNDTFWGVCRGEGRNELGKLLMKLRGELQNKL